MHLITVDDTLTLSAPSTSTSTSTSTSASGLQGFKSSTAGELPDFTGFVGLKNGLSSGDLTVTFSSITSKEQIVPIADEVIIPSGCILYLAADCASSTVYSLALASADRSSTFTLTIKGRVGAPRVSAADASSGLLEVWGSCRANGLALVRNESSNASDVTVSPGAVNVSPGSSGTLELSGATSIDVSLSEAVNEAVTVYDQQRTSLEVWSESSSLGVDTRAITVAPQSSVDLTITNNSGSSIQIDCYQIDTSGTIETEPSESYEVDDQRSKCVVLNDSSHYLSISQASTTDPGNVGGPVTDDPNTGMFLWDDPVVLIKHSGRGGSKGG